MDSVQILLYKKSSVKLITELNHIINHTKHIKITLRTGYESIIYYYKLNFFEI